MRGYYGRPRHGMRRNPRSGHTPGPWYVEAGGEVWAERPDPAYRGARTQTVRIADPDIASSGKTTAFGVNIEFEEVCANARLIAAAPVMRDALVEARKALNTVFGHRCFTEGQQQQIGEALEFVIKAIEDTKLFSERERLGG